MDDCENKIIKLNKIEPHHGHDCVDISNNTQSKNEDQTMNKEDENNKTQECVKENNDVKNKENKNDDTQCNEGQQQQMQMQMKVESKPTYLEQLIALDLNNTKKEDVIKLLMQNSIKSGLGYQTTQLITLKEGDKSDKGIVCESKQEVKRKESEKQQIEVQNKNVNDDNKNNTEVNKEKPKTENTNNETNNKENEAKVNTNENVKTSENVKANENVNANTNTNANAQSNTNVNANTNTNNNINGIYSKTGKYHIFKEPNNPEYINDFNTAVHRIKNKLNADDKKDLLTQLLCFDPNPKSNQVQYDLSANDYEEKYKGIIAKKQENLEKTIQKYNDDYKDIYTFMPTVNKLPNDQRRNIDQFIEDQKRFTEKKQKHLQDKLQQKQMNTIEQTKPKKQKPLTKNEQNELYDRLYKNINRYKQNNPKDNTNNNTNNNTNCANTNTNNNNKPTSPSKVPKKKPNFNSTLYQPSKPRQCSKSPLKLHSSSLHSETMLFNNHNNNNILLKQSDISTYKILMSSFLERFRDVASTLLQIKQSSSVIIDNNIKSSSPRDLYQLENLSFQKLLDFMTLLGMLTKSSMHSPLGQSIDSTIHQNEKKLLFMLFDSLKTEHNVIQLEHLKKFLFAVLGLHSFALYEEFKIKHKVNEIDQLLKNENIPKKTQQCVDFMIKTQNDENTSRVDVNNKQNNKYVSYTNSNELIISLAQAKKIRSDFNIFSISYMSNRKRNKHKHVDTNVMNNNENEYDDYNNNNNENEVDVNDNMKVEIKEEVNNEGFESEQMEHFARLAMIREKKVMEMQRLKDESEKQLMKECTFQPNVKCNNNKSSISPNNNNNDKKYNKKTGINKSIELYQQSKDKNILKKQNRTKDESEYERHKHEYTFTPNTKQTFPSVSSSNTSNDFNSKSYTLFFERMKNGKADRMVKDAVHDRYGLDESLKAYIKYNKHIPSSTQTCYYTNTEYAYYNNKRKNKSAGKIRSKLHQHQQVESEEEEEFTESVPLLIIDVNIKQGVKKKLLVYEKDTPEELADKFAKENNLDNQTKEKLQTLIRNHMQRLLTRIDEENPTSIKSTVNSNQQIKTDI